MSPQDDPGGESRLPPDRGEAPDPLQTAPPAGRAVPHESSDPWILCYEGLDPGNEGLREALCALGNGKFVTRGAAEECVANEIHYPGTYFAGGYNRLSSEIAGRTVVNEDLVNFPNWLPLTFRPEDGGWLDLSTMEALDYRQELRLHEGVLFRKFRVRDGHGRETSIESRRIVSMTSPHHAAIEYQLTPLNWSGVIRIRSEIDGTVTNSGVARYSQLANQHLEVMQASTVAPEGIYLVAETVHSHFRVATGARTRIFAGANGARLEPERVLPENPPGRIGEELRLEVVAGETVRVEKIATLFSSRDRGIAEPGMEARIALGSAPDFSGLLEKHRQAWAALWRRYDIEIDEAPPPTSSGGRMQLILRLHIFHLLQTVSPHTVGLDVGAPARGLHGEAYRGHVFWDELFIFPFYDFRTPAITRSLLLYRYHRLDAARELARAEGYEGAMFPWQSGSDGREATQELHLNPLSGRWDPDHSHLQRHVNAAIIYNLWHYWRATGDREFLIDYGAEIVVEIARFWASIARWNDERRRYDIHGVMGPDEYHEKYPDAESGGLKNNAYTNVMASWCLHRAADVLEEIGPRSRADLLSVLGIDEDAPSSWRRIADLIFVPFIEGDILEQFEGYAALEELDWDAYRKKYGNIERLDRILKAEGDTPDRYQLSKQADATMLFYLFEPDEVTAMLGRMGYEFGREAMVRTIEYYRSRTSHGSTLSKMVYATVMQHLDPGEGCRLFMDALRSDINDTQRGTTPEGIHLGAMAGTVGIVLRRYAGIGLESEGITLEPSLPPGLERIRCQVHWRGRWIEIELTRAGVQVRPEEGMGGGVPVRIGGNWQMIEGPAAG